MTPRKTESSEAESDTSDSASLEAPSAPASESQPALAAPHPSAAIVDEWFTKHFHNMSALFDERAYRHLLGAKEDLKVSLAQSV